MQVVVNIPDDKWVSIQKGEYCGILDAEMYKNIKNGKQLPKGYGGFLDADFIEWNSCEDMFNCPSQNMECKDCSRKMCRIYKH